MTDRQLSSARDTMNVLSYRQGNEDSFEELFGKYKPHIIIWLSGYNRKFPRLYNDILQEGSIGFLKAIRDFNEDMGKPFFHFANMCVVRHVYSYIKTQSRLEGNGLLVDLQEEEYVYGYKELLRGTTQYFEDELIKEIWLQGIWEEYLTTLTALEKETIELHMQGYDYNEIADRVGVGYKSVDNAMYRSRKRFRKIESKRMGDI